MLILSSPSGAGKTTLARRLLEDEGELTMSVSVTTREPRPGEVEGTDYTFIDEEQFRQMVEHNELLEYATVFGNSYGTPRGPVEEALEEGDDIIFDIDWQGTQQLVQKAGRDDVVSIFVLPPSMDELAARLVRRGQDSDNVVSDRMARAADEISHWAEYDYVLVNEDIEKCLAQVRSILAVERLRRRRQRHLTGLVRDLMGKA
jgi:guanylate kinase